MVAPVHGNSALYKEVFKVQLRMKISAIKIYRERENVFDVLRRLRPMLNIPLSA